MRSTAYWRDIGRHDADERGDFDSEEAHAFIDREPGASTMTIVNKLWSRKRPVLLRHFMEDWGSEVTPATRDVAFEAWGFGWRAVVTRFVEKIAKSKRNPASTRVPSLADWRQAGTYDCEHGFDAKAFAEARRDHPFASAKQLVDHVWAEDRAQVFEEWLANRGADEGLTRATGRAAFEAWGEGWRAQAVVYVIDQVRRRTNPAPKRGGAARPISTVRAELRKLHAAQRAEAEAWRAIIWSVTSEAELARARAEHERREEELEAKLDVLGREYMKAGGRPDDDLS